MSWIISTGLYLYDTYSEWIEVLPEGVKITIAEFGGASVFILIGILVDKIQS